MKLPGRPTWSRACLLLILFVLGCSMTAPTSPSPAEDVDPNDLPKVMVPLLGSTRDIRGINLPDGLHADRVGGPDLLEPHLLTISLPDGRSLPVTARSMSLITRNGFVTDVYVRRPMRPVRFKVAVADFRAVMKSLEIEPDDQMTKHIASWGEDNPGREEGANPDPVLFRTTVEFAPGICSLDIRVKPDLDSGWYYLMIFGADLDARKAAYAAHEAAKAAGSALPAPAQSARGVAPTVVSSPTFSQVTVRLGGPAADARGVQIPPTREGDPTSTADVAHPHALTIELPGDRKPLLLLARSSSFTSKSGTVNDINIHRPMLPLPYEKAITDLLNTLKALGIDSTSVAARLESNTPSERRDMSIELPGAPNAFDVRIKLKSEPDDAWSYSLELKVKE